MNVSLTGPEGHRGSKESVNQDELHEGGICRTPSVTPYGPGEGTSIVPRPLNPQVVPYKPLHYAYDDLLDVETLNRNRSHPETTGTTR